MDKTLIATAFILEGRTDFTLNRKIEEVVIEYARKRNITRIERTLLSHQVPKMIIAHYKENDWDLEELDLE